jgi:integration host factor subunit alpha
MIDRGWACSGYKSPNLFRLLDRIDGVKERTKSENTRNFREAGVPAVKDVDNASQRTSRRTVVRVDLVEAVYRRLGLSRKESALLVQAVLDELADALVAGESVKLSSFGRFFVRSKSERIGRNPKTGVEVPISQRRVMVFKPSHVLRARINGLAPDDEESD